MVAVLNCTMPDNPDLQLQSVNVQGLRTSQKRLDLFRAMAAMDGPYGKTEIFCLQETHCKYTDLEEWTKDWTSTAGEVSFSLFSEVTEFDTGCGVAILYKCKRLNDYVKIKPIDSEEGRRCAVELSWGGHERILLWCVYAPASGPYDRVRFLKNCDWKEKDYDTILLTGDFNIPLSVMDSDSPADKAKRPDRMALTNVLGSLKLEDSLRIYKKKGNFPTHLSQAAGRSTGKRLDYWFTPVSFRKFVESSEVCAYGPADHNCVQITIRQLRDKEAKGIKPWRLKDEILSDEDCKRRVDEVLALPPPPHLNPMQHEAPPAGR